MDDDDVYECGLNSEDWICLRDVVWPFIHAESIESINVPEVPDYLKEHELGEYIKKYKETGDDKYLDKA